MGNDNSRLKGLIIDENAVEANDFWALYNAELPSALDEGRQLLSFDEGKQLLSIFVGEPLVAGQLWLSHGPLERAVKNLMIYRHPYILKYVATWEQSGQKHLATERVRPLASELSKLSDIQMCLGLRTILCSLIFLIEKANARHLNICVSSIFIALDGSWHLGGFEYVWKSKEVNKTLLNLIAAYRHKNAMMKNAADEMQGNNNSDYIEQYAFGTLCEEILSKLSKECTAATTCVQEFLQFCSAHLKHPNAQMRPQLSAVLLHPYFNHEFILIHSFLIELPLKNATQRHEFFTTLMQRLHNFDEKIIGEHLAGLLLSRMVLLDSSAQLCVTPYVLRPKSVGDGSVSVGGAGSVGGGDYAVALFSPANYKRYLLPHIRKSFCMRDAQIRLILLEYFMDFVRLLSVDELRQFILPHLRLALRDTNDVLVAKTMHCLAELIPLLGSTLVVGGERRMRLFSDGRPQAATLPNIIVPHWIEARSITPVIGGAANNCLDYMVSGSPLPSEHTVMTNSLNSLLPPHNIINIDDDDNEIVSQEMPPRLSPDGGEDEKLDVITIEADSSSVEKSSEQLLIQYREGRSVLMRDDDDDENIVRAKQKNTVTALYSSSAEEDAWSDWETEDLERLNNDKISSQAEQSQYLSNIESMPIKQNTNEVNDFKNTLITTSNSSATAAAPTTTTPLKTNLIKSSNLNDDLSLLDIVVQKTVATEIGSSEPFDYFKDMEPVIEKRNEDLFHTSSSSSSNKKLSPTIVETEFRIDPSRFAANVISNENTVISNGWSVDDDDVWNVAI